MKLYEFFLPVNDNSGAATGLARAQFQEDVLQECGGFSMGAHKRGAWADNTGKVFYDEIAPITIACEPIQRDWLLRRAFELFPDQKAIFVAEIGEATIYEREIK